MATIRLWLFRGLAIIAAVLMLVSVKMPWWTADVSTEASTPSGVTAFTVSLYQYGIPSSMGASFYSTDVTPFFQTILAWVYIGVSIGLILLSTWLKGKKGKWLLGGIGLVYVAYAVIALVLITIRTKDYGISLQGHTYVEQYLASIDTGLHLGYYLTYASGLACIVLAVFRDRILGKGKLNALKTGN